jgi:putative ATP-dependent endonuclease of OLD family
MAVIKKIKLRNFKRFQSFSVELDEKINLLIGDNESGKSSILSAIDIVLSGSRTKVETMGLDSLFNADVVRNFLASDRKIEKLPQLFVELYLDEQDNVDLNGRNNSDGIECDGLRLICEPDDLFSKEIKEVLEQDEPNFPFEFYSISFRTFADNGYVGYRKYLRHVLIDNAQISNEYATRDFVKTMYNSSVRDAERNKHQNEYRKYKDAFRKSVLTDLNDRIPAEYSFAIKTGSKASLETDLTISENDINIEHKGKGKQCFIKTEFALKKVKDKDLDIVLIEEPENHLSHINMKRLIRKIGESDGRQLFIATHSDLVSSRLDLRKSILLNKNSLDLVLLKDLSEDTAKFFMKAPNNKILEFILSEKVILVEGDAEFILMDSLFQKIALQKLEDVRAHVISVGGTSFKRYLDLAKLLRIKTAVIRDNDCNYQSNCVDNYSGYTDDWMRVFSDKDNTRSTFEIALYQDNTELCEALFTTGRRTLSVQDYMLQNKADVAFELLEKKGDEIIPPDYIKEAIEWIKK